MRSDSGWDGILIQVGTCTRSGRTAGWKVGIWQRGTRGKAHGQPLQLLQQAINASGGRVQDCTQGRRSLLGVRWQQPGGTTRQSGLRRPTSSTDSTEAARCRTRSREQPSLSCFIASSRKRPSVSVPVLSTQRVRIRESRSICFEDLIKMPVAGGD